MKRTTLGTLFRYSSACLLLILMSTNAYAIFVVGHRGARGLAPESTLPGYKIAIQKGVQYIDMDIVMTKDHELVVFHDLALNPDITRDSKGAWIKNKILIKELTLKELKKFNVGAIKPGSFYHQLFPHQKPIKNASIPTLKEIMIYAKKLNKNIRFQIEIKTDPAMPSSSFEPSVITKKLVSLLNEMNTVEQVRIQAFDWRCLYEVQSLNSRIKTAYLTSQEQVELMRHADPAIAGLWTGGKLLKDFNDSIPEMIKTLGGSAWDPESHSLNEKDRLRAAELGIQVVVWSDTKKVDYDAKEVKRILHLKVDGIISDRPDLALQDVKRALSS